MVTSDKVKFDMELFKLVIGMREGLPFPLLRREIQKYLRTMTTEQKQTILDKRQEIVNSWLEWKEANYYVLTRLGFTAGEAEILKDKRLHSPGMRNVIRNRAMELGFMRPDPAEGGKW